MTYSGAKIDLILKYGAKILNLGTCRICGRFGSHILHQVCLCRGNVFLYCLVVTLFQITTHIHKKIPSGFATNILTEPTILDNPPQDIDKSLPTTFAHF